MSRFCFALICAALAAGLSGCDDGGSMAPPADGVPPDAAAEVDVGRDAEPVVDMGPTPDLTPAPDMGPDMAPDAAPDPGELCDRWPEERLEPEPWGGGWSPESGDLPPALAPAADEFIVAVLPDTQIYAQRFPDAFDSQLRWIAENAARYRIVFVSHVGDIVQNGDARDQWAVARAAFDWIDDIDLPHGHSIGSHDVVGRYDYPIDSSCAGRDPGRMDCDATEYKANFGPDIYGDRAWYGGASPSGLSSYQVIEVDGMALLFLHLVMDTPEPEVEWAGEVLDAHPGALAHLTTHRYLFDYRLTEALPTPLDLFPSGRFTQLTYNVGDQGLVYVDGLSANELFERLVAAHPNIWAVHCGHVDAEFRQASTNAAGLPVHEILVDFQNLADGGGGWLRLLKFAPARDVVEVITYSTTSGEVRRNGAGFDHAVDILDDYRSAAQPFLDGFGLDEATVDALLAEVRMPGDLQDEYYRSLYCGGQRDSRFVLDVDFDAYIAAGGAGN